MSQFTQYCNYMRIILDYNLIILFLYKAEKSLIPYNVDFDHFIRYYLQ